MPYVDDSVIETLDYFMVSIGRKRAWELLRKRIFSGGSGSGDCDNDGCAEAIKQTKINKANIATNVSNIATNASNITANTTNIATNTTNIGKNTNDIAELKDRLDNLVIEGVDKADPSDMDEWFNNNE